MMIDYEKDRGINCHFDLWFYFMRDAIDSLDHSHVIWRPYERRGHITPFQDICWYSEWIMAGKGRRVRHLPEQVLRQYRYVQTRPRPPRGIQPFAADDVAMAFMEFALHLLSQKERGHLVPNNEPWAHSRGYMRWFVRVSHPIANPPAAVLDYAADAHPCPVPPYEEVLVEQ